MLVFICIFIFGHNFFLICCCLCRPSRQKGVYRRHVWNSAANLISQIPSDPNNWESVAISQQLCIHCASATNIIIYFLYVEQVINKPFITLCIKSPPSFRLDWLDTFILTRSQQRIYAISHSILHYYHRWIDK